MNHPTVMFEITRLEAEHLRGLLQQFRELLAGSGTGAPTDDEAVARLVPDAYPDDEGSAREFRELTEGDLLRRRDDDAQQVLDSLGDPARSAEASDADVIVIDLGPERFEAWIRTLAAVRLILASRLGVTDEGDHDPEDPRFGVYDWLGYRLESLLQVEEREG